MKRLIVLLCLGVMILPLMAQEIKLTGEMWNRWTLETGNAPAGENTILRNNLSLERGYLGLEPKFSDAVKGRFTVDIFSTDLVKDGAGLKIKYAYLDFNKLLPIPDMTTTIGLQKVYFGSIYDWDYTLIGKSPTDEYKFANSADYGITINGFIPGGWGEYALGVYNGEGYKNYGSNLKGNIEPAFLANLRVIPITGLTLGGSFMLNSSERSDSLTGLGGDNPKYNEQKLMDAYARAAYGPLSLMGEYMMKDVTYPNKPANDMSANCASVNAVLKLKTLVEKDIDFVVRYDRSDPTDSDKDENIVTAVTGGVNYNFMHDDSSNPAMQLQLNYTTKSNSVKSDNDSSALMLQLKWRFNNTLKV